MCFGKSLKKGSLKVQNEQGVFLSILEETMTGLRIVKAFNVEKMFADKFEDSNNRFYKFSNSLLNRQNLASPLSELLGIIVIGVLLVYGGYLVFEVAHALKLVEQKLFDTIYHEHMSYHTVISLDIFIRKLGFNLINVEEIEMHGGSIRVTCQKSASQSEVLPEVKEIFRREVLAGLDSSDWMKKFNRHLDQLSLETKSAIQAEPMSTTWFGYGAPAKAVTFINQFDLDQIGLIGIIDDNPGKQGKFLPRSGIKVVSQAEMESDLIPRLKPTNLNCVIFPWNLSAEIAS